VRSNTPKADIALAVFLGLCGAFILFMLLSA
jgi:hypothetical protein